MDPANNLRPPSERTYGLEHVAVGADVRVSALSLVSDECVAWHWHTHISDIFFVLEGTAVIETHNPGNAVHVNVGERHDVLAGCPASCHTARRKKVSVHLGAGCRKSGFSSGATMTSLQSLYE